MHLQAERAVALCSIQNLEFVQKYASYSLHGRRGRLRPLEDRRGRILERMREIHSIWLKLDSDPWMWPELMEEEEFGHFPEPVGVFLLSLHPDKDWREG